MSHLPFLVFKTADLPPEQDFLQEQETDRASVRAKRQKPMRLQRALIRVRREARRKFGATAKLSHILHRTIPIIVELKGAFPTLFKKRHKLGWP
jgi:hypothetical protein